METIHIKSGQQGRAQELFGKPFLLGVGPQRCGNQWLERYFRGRGDVCLPAQVKEICYFDRHFHRGPAFYRSHFDVEPAHAAVMELTTTAFDTPDAPAQARALLGADIRLFCPLRHPVARSVAVYADYLAYGLVKAPLQDAVEDAPQILRASFYAEHLQRWFDVFGPEKVTVCFSEEMETRPAAFIEDLCAALQISHKPFQEEDGAPARKAGAGIAGRLRTFMSGRDVDFRGSVPVGPLRYAPARTVDEGEMRWLRDMLEPEIEKVEMLLGRAMPFWRV